MGKNTINPDYYKVRGRGPQSNDVLQDLNRQQYAEARAREKREEAHPPPRAGGAQPAPEKREDVEPPRAGGAQPALEPPAAAPAETQRFPESVLHEKRNDPRDGAQDLEVEDDAIGEGRQTSVKMGTKSSAKKMQRRRHNAGPIPATSPVAGAFGRRAEEEAPPEEEEK